MSNFFSIAIPTYEMFGLGATFLEESFRKLDMQSFKDFEVVVSDHSIGEEIADICEAWSGKFAIRYLKNNYKKGSSSANLNNAISNCTGEWVKILFQDDFVYNQNSLEIIKTHIEFYSPIWIACACEHTHDGKNMYRTFYPKWNDELDIGNNTISSPSVICLKNANVIYFDEELSWLMDVEYYKRMFDLYGEPSYIYDIVVVNRTWHGSLTSQTSDEIKNKELEFITKKRTME